MLCGARGFGAPGGGGSRRRFAVRGTPASVPLMAPFGPGVAVPVKCCVLPLTQLTSPVSGCGADLGACFEIALSRSWPLSVPWLFVRFTNCPDCFTSNEGPLTGACAGAVGGSGGPIGGGGAAPRHGFGALAS